ncbi:rhodanese-like domain-containing protein [Kordiimonas sp.]|uniref:rhodanese-like domain-containing protein n=1 Tax=Kordiimonas sp. TaxID=1970157 RepID=UPI003A9175A7
MVLQVDVADFWSEYELNRELFVIDVRTEAEYAACHVHGAKLYPLQDFNPVSVLAAADKAGADAPIYILCKGGGRAQQAGAKLVAAGSAHPVVVVQGGTDACAALGMPVKEGKPVMSPERQVRIAAGGLVLAGVVLGVLVNPGFYALSGFVGAGLMFAGITDTCAMGMMIARMPWNKVKA